jgi:late competence protein required for DNA uptake (superfamily II DNA/RNA helicase)
MSINQDNEFCCNRCAEWFSKDEMIEDDGLLYCRECYDILLSSGEI